MSRSLMSLANSCFGILLPALVATFDLQWARHVEFLPGSERNE